MKTKRNNERPYDVLLKSLARTSDRVYRKILRQAEPPNSDLDQPVPPRETSVLLEKAPLEVMPTEAPSTESPDFPLEQTVEDLIALSPLYVSGSETIARPILDPPPIRIPHRTITSDQWMKER